MYHTRLILVTFPVGQVLNLIWDLTLTVLHIAIPRQGTWNSLCWAETQWQRVAHRSSRSAWKEPEADGGWWRCWGWVRCMEVLVIAFMSLFTVSSLPLHTFSLFLCIFFSPCPSHFLCTYKGYVETNVQLCEANCAQPVPETSVTIIISELYDYGIEELAHTQERKGAEHHILFCQVLFGGCREYTHSWAAEVVISCAIEWKLEVSKPSLCTNFSSTVKPHLIY